MTSKIFAATAFAAIIVFSSCNQVFGHKELPEHLLIKTIWKLDSVNLSGETDSSAPHFFFKAVDALVLKDTSAPSLQFSKDTILITTIQKEFRKYLYYLDEQNRQIFIKEDSVYTPHKYFIKDSLLQLS